MKSRLDDFPPIDGNPKAKNAFHLMANGVLHRFAKKLGIPRREYDVRHNYGGSAVCGEITLHSDKLYVQISQGHTGKLVLWRTCNGRKDYTGGPNNWCDVSKLEEKPETFRSYA